jgi:hypothetical protein
MHLRRFVNLPISDGILPTILFWYNANEAEEEEKEND